VFRQRVHPQRGDVGDCGGLHRSPDGFVQQRLADALLQMTFMDRQAAEDERGNRVRAMALDAVWRGVEAKMAASAHAAHVLHFGPHSELG
jgi:hypothetical protein